MKHDTTRPAGRGRLAEAALTAFTVVLLAGSASAQDPLSRVSAQGRQKISSHALDQLMSTFQPEFIVEIATADQTATMGQLADHSRRATTLQRLESAFEQRKAAVLGRRGARVQRVSHYNLLPYVHVRAKDRKALADLLNDSDVAAVYPITYLAPYLASSLPVTEQPTVEKLAAVTGKGTTVAVLDTGVDYTQSDFGSCTAGSPAWQPAASASCRVVRSLDMGDNDGQMDDSTNQHGTNVSAIVAGMAPGTGVVMLDVFSWLDVDGDGVLEHRAPNTNLLNALNWVLNNQNSLNIVAANMSLGSVQDLDADGWGDGDLDGTGDVGYTTATCPNTFATLFGQLLLAGVVPVTAAGNDGLAGMGAWPACEVSSTTVGAIFDSNLGFNRNSAVLNVLAPVQGFTTGVCTDAAPQAAGQVTCFSNSDSNVTLVAPGVNVTAGGQTLSGTSMASPHVAGALALLDEAGGHALTASQIQQDLLATQRSVTDPKWPTAAIPELDVGASLVASSIWTTVIERLDTTNWYDRLSDEQLLYGVGSAHRFYGIDATNVDQERLEEVLRAPALGAALAPILLPAP